MYWKTDLPAQGIIHAKILWSFTHPYAILNLHDFLYSVGHKKDILKNVSAVFIHIMKVNGTQHYKTPKGKY